MTNKETPEFYRSYILSIGKWIILAVLVAAVCGPLGALFHKGIDVAAEAFGEYPYLIFALPLLGLVITFLYQKTSLAGKGTDTIIEACEKGEKVPVLLLPVIFVSTILTHLGGGSSGREGAALQIGGTAGSIFGRMLRFSKEDLGIATMVGMAAFFAALFGTPVTAVVFVACVIKVGEINPVMFFPGTIASVLSYTVSKKLGMEPFGFALDVPELTMTLSGKVMIAALLAGLVSVLFCEVMHRTGDVYKKLLPNPYIRVVAGGLIVIGLTLLLGTRDYNGAGGSVIARAVVEGKAHPAAFALKIIFTALTLEAGFKGGEIVPTFFIGATFGCAVSSLLGLPPQLGAAVGMIATFGGATNTLLAPVILSVEAFGSAGIILFALTSCTAYVVSGYNGLYSAQTILYSKVKGETLNKKTNHVRETKKN